MIEINVKAKGADPWDTPPLTWETLQQKREQGYLVAYFLFSQEDGYWKLYDNMNPRSVYQEGDLHKYLQNPHKWQVRAHAKSRIVLAQPVSYHYEIAGHLRRTIISQILAENITKLKEKIEQAKETRPGLKLLTPQPTWYTIENVEGAPIAIS